MNFNNLDDIEAYITRQINNGLKNEVARVVKDTMADEIQTTVYGVYSPIMYERRYGNGGLSDERNMRDELVSDGVLAVSNETPLNDRYGSSYSRKSLSEIVISGEGYMYHSQYGNNGYEQPRDFIDATIRSLQSTGAHVEALKNALRKAGIDAR